MEENFAEFQKSDDGRQVHYFSATNPGQNTSIEMWMYKGMEEEFNPGHSLKKFKSRLLLAREGKYNGLPDYIIEEFHKLKIEEFKRSMQNRRCLRGQSTQPESAIGPLPIQWALAQREQMNRTLEDNTTIQRPESREPPARYQYNRAESPDRAEGLDYDQPSTSGFVNTNNVFVNPNDGFKAPLSPRKGPRRSAADYMKIFDSDSDTSTQPSRDQTPFGADPEVSLRRTMRFCQQEARAKGPGPRASSICPDIPVAKPPVLKAPDIRDTDFDGSELSTGLKAFRQQMFEKYYGNLTTNFPFKVSDNEKKCLLMGKSEPLRKWLKEMKVSEKSAETFLKKRDYWDKISKRDWIKMNEQKRIEPPNVQQNEPSRRSRRLNGEGPLAHSNFSSPTSRPSSNRRPIDDDEAVEIFKSPAPRERSGSVSSQRAGRPEVNGAAPEVPDSRRQVSLDPGLNGLSLKLEQNDPEIIDVTPPPPRERSVSVQSRRSERPGTSNANQQDPRDLILERIDFEPEPEPVQNGGSRRDSRAGSTARSDRRAERATVEEPDSRRSSRQDSLNHMSQEGASQRPKASRAGSTTRDGRRSERQEQNDLEIIYFTPPPPRERSGSAQSRRSVRGEEIDLEPVQNGGSRRASRAESIARNDRRSGRQEQNDPEVIDVTPPPVRERSGSAQSRRSERPGTSNQLDSRRVSPEVIDLEPVQNSASRRTSRAGSTARQAEQDDEDLKIVAVLPERSPPEESNFRKTNRQGFPAMLHEALNQRTSRARSTTRNDRIPIEEDEPEVTFACIVPTPEPSPTRSSVSRRARTISRAESVASNSGTLFYNSLVRYRQQNGLPAPEKISFQEEDGSEEIPQPEVQDDQVENPNAENRSRSVTPDILLPPYIKARRREAALRNGASNLRRSSRAPSVQSNGNVPTSNEGFKAPAEPMSRMNSNEDSASTQNGATGRAIRAASIQNGSHSSRAHPNPCDNRSSSLQPSFVVQNGQSNGTGVQTSLEAPAEAVPRSNRNGDPGDVSTQNGIIRRETRAVSIQNESHSVRASPSQSANGSSSLQASSVVENGHNNGNEVFPPRQNPKLENHDAKPNHVLNEHQKRARAESPKPSTSGSGPAPKRARSPESRTMKAHRCNRTREDIKFEETFLLYKEEHKEEYRLMAKGLGGKEYDFWDTFLDNHLKTVLESSPTHLYQELKRKNRVQDIKLIGNLTRARDDLSETLQVRFAKEKYTVGNWKGCLDEALRDHFDDWKGFEKKTLPLPFPKFFMELYFRDGENRKRVRGS